MNFIPASFISRTLVTGGLLLALVACSDRAPSIVDNMSPEEKLVHQGSQAARLCVGCHGPKGISRVASYPSIAGRSQTYLAEQLHAFRDGTRENPMMSSIVKSMDDDDILALSYYFSSLPGPDMGGTKSEERAP